MSYRGAHWSQTGVALAYSWLLPLTRRTQACCARATAQSVGAPLGGGSCFQAMAWDTQPATAGPWLFLARLLVTV